MARTVLALFKKRAGTWIPREEIGRYAGSEHVVDDVLDALVSAFVLDSEGDPPRFRYQRDSVTELEIERYFKKADRHETRVRTNVQRFRQRYHVP